MPVSHSDFSENTESQYISIFCLPLCMGVEGFPTFSGPLSPEQTIIFQSAAICNDFQIAMYMCTYI